VPTLADTKFERKKRSLGHQLIGWVLKKGFREEPRGRDKRGLRLKKVISTMGTRKHAENRGIKTKRNEGRQLIPRGGGGRMGHPAILEPE